MDSAPCKCGRAVFLLGEQAVCIGCDKLERWCACAPLEQNAGAWADVDRRARLSLRELLEQTRDAVEAFDGWEVEGIRREKWRARVPVRLRDRMPGRAAWLEADTAQDLVRRVRELEGAPDTGPAVVQLALFGGAP